MSNPSKQEVTQEQEQEQQCIICAEKYTKIKSRIQCPKCNFECCKHCIQNYILSRAEDPHCMSCKTQHNDEFLYQHINKTFMNASYRKHKTNLLFEIEKSRIPETMARVEDYKKNKKAQEEYNQISQRISELKLEMYRLENIKAKKGNLINRYQTGRAVNEHPVPYYGMPDQYENNTTQDQQEQHQEKKKFIHNCPYDDCKGFLSSAWKCGVCEKWACSKCFEGLGTTKDPDHVCKKENIESANLIRKETKPCPTCAVPIMKSSGCDQMWCTQCKVAFSWKTGKIVLGGVIHNPHYYQYMHQYNENNGHAAMHNPGDVACGGIPNYYHMRHRFSSPLCDLMRITSKYIRILNYNLNPESNPESNPDSNPDPNSIPTLDQKQKYKEKYKEIYEPEIAAKLNKCKVIIDKIIEFNINEFHRVLNHNRDMIFTMRTRVMELQGQADGQNEHGERREMRVKFIINDISEEKYKAFISKKERERKKLVRILQIFELYETITIETFNNVYAVDVLNIRNKENKIYYSIGIKESTNKESTNNNPTSPWYEEKEDEPKTLKFNPGAIDKTLNYFKEIEKFIDRCNSIEEYCKEELEKVKKQYNSKKYSFKRRMINI